MPTKSILNLDLKELEKILSRWGEKRFHARQVFSWIYQKRARDFDKMSDLSTGLRKKLTENFSILDLEVIKRLESSDGTKKLLFKLNDGNAIEAVNIPAEKRITACVSTQVGCKFACGFCASGMLGFKRNLEAAEIIQQALILQDEAGQRLNNLVFMGIGEPLDNYDNVLKAIKIINAPWSLNIGARKITISSSGFIPGIKRLMEEKLQTELSVSLHAVDDKTRSTLMPINKKYPLKDLIAVIKEYIRKTNRQVTFEYILIEGLNSDVASAKALGKLLKGLVCKVNLIPCNPIAELGFAPPGKLAILLFKNELSKQGIDCTLRMPRGRDIQAACGQLSLGGELKAKRPVFGL
ncbi:MAG: 23S rRNA (adenine(2503)-C(2))-methyltransferase RlmN [Candidatus Omnitrophica bacterium]|nr:23S rRNA (adenine(2503)-C(2))-methyltransferase RlmN [Candidatus Omnitrophota bacterium]